MLKKWEVVPAPNEKNPGRHKLLIKGEMKDIFLIVKKLGSICSRPEKTSGDFNFVIYLSRVEADITLKLKAVTAELGSIGGEENDGVVQAGAGFQCEPPVVLKPALQAAPAPAPEPKPAPQAAPAPAPLQPSAEQPVTSLESTQPRRNFVPSSTTRIKKEELAAASLAVVPDVKPAKSFVPASKIKAKWSMELPLIPTYSFQTLISGSHNRFAHAAAMAVVESPGVIYNPLLLFGASGSGKTHFINAVSSGLAASLGQGNIFVTNGVKFSKGVELAIKEGGVDRLEELFSGIKALIIDDVHLLMVSEINKKHISKWLNDFVAKNKQIVVTSLFSPKSLAGLEDSVGFQFTQGWMVDLKIPPAQTYKTILNQLLQGMGIKVAESDICDFFVQKQMPFGDAITTFEAIKKLEKFVVTAANNLSHSQLLEMLTGLQESPQVPPSEQELSAAAAWQASSQEEWFKWGIFYPKGMRREAQYALSLLHGRAKELGMNTAWRQVFMQEYDPEEAYGAPFSIGNYAAQQDVNGAIVLGPPPASAMGAQEAEFRQLSLKILDSFFIKGAWLPLGKAKSPAVYVRALMDLV
ncbi:MAG: hypothetical protein A2285_10640 [Elusimicrobia bacterium RIFOXYA12_FULL_57_11]|nr:MAG: hypothetical protein A2285_10640 [Elusimicrobia bacterium RIFOXYA12_FULL_57_11]